MYKIKSHPTTLDIYSKKMVANGLYNIDKIDEFRINFKKFLEKEFLASKNYKSELNGLMEFGQDLNLVLEKIKGVSGVDIKKILEVGKKISLIPDVLQRIKHYEGI